MSLLFSKKKKKKYSFFYIVTFSVQQTIDQQNKQCSYHTALIARVFKYVRKMGMSPDSAREYSVPESTWRDQSLGI